MGIIKLGLVIATCLLICGVFGDPFGEPLVAFMCNKPTMYMSDNGWVEDRTTDCIEDPEDILKYCQKVYPDKDITNVVESNELLTIDNWCSFEKPKCHKHNSHTIRPFRCLVGPFQSDALLVPEHCLFDHKHGAKCGRYADWNITAVNACKTHKMKLQSFALLQPCGTNIFNGVEFVCCPMPLEGKEDKGNKPFIVEDDSNLLKIVDNDKDKAVIADNTPEDWKPKKIANENSVFYEHYIQKSKDDSFLNEHEYFFKAKNDLQKHHHDRVTKMMKEWAEARQKVADMKEVDPKGAEKLNKDITGRFQKSYEALEQEGMSEKVQLIAIHQQRVQSDLNDKKRSAMEHYMDTLTDATIDATKILKALKHYIKAEEKDRLHSLNHYKHVHDADPDEARTLKEQTQAHLDIINQRVDQAIDMLKRVPEVEKKVRQQIEDYLATFRELDSAIAATLYSTEPEKPAEPEKPESESEEEDEEIKTEPKQQWEEINPGKKVEKTQDVPPAQNEIYHVPLEKSEPEIDIKKIEEEEEIDENEENEHNIPEMQVKHADNLRQNDMQVQRMQDPYEKHDQIKQSKTISMIYSSSASAGIAVAAIAVFVIIVAGVLVLRKRSQRSNRGGFVEVDQAASPEERHVANMQMNGYENPTYRYFETSQQPA